MSNQESSLENILLNLLNNTFPAANTSTQSDQIIHILDRYQRNIELYNRNMEVYNRNVNIMLPQIRINTQPNTNAHTVRTNPLSSGRYWTAGYFASPNTTSQSNRDISDNDIPTAYATSTQSNQTIPTVNMTQEITEFICSEADSIGVCPITLSQFEVGENLCKINRCGHVFKRNALYRWVYDNGTCPVCRCSLQSWTQ
jgi:hypothetical protein